jgi:hypothetical protein
MVGSEDGLDEGLFVGNGNVGKLVGSGVMVGEEVGLSVDLVNKGSPSIRACTLLPTSSITKTCGSTNVIHDRPLATETSIVSRASRNISVVLRLCLCLCLRAI